MLLAIETAGDTCGVALVVGGEVVAAQSRHGPRLHAASLAPMIAELLSEAGARPVDLAAVAVSSGPGSYTGLRIGVSTAKGLCVASGAVLVAVPTLGALGRAASEVAADDERIVAALPSRRGEAYAAAIDAGDPIARPAAAAYVLDSLPADAFGEGPLLIVGPSAGAVAAALERAGHPRVRYAETAPDPVPVAEIGWLRWRAGLVEDLAAFEPEYVTGVYVGGG